MFIPIGQARLMKRTGEHVVASKSHSSPGDLGSQRERPVQKGHGIVGMQKPTSLLKEG